MWVVVLVGFLCFAAGLAVGGFGGFAAGVGSQFADELRPPRVGSGAEQAAGPLDGVFEVGELALTDVEVARDFADDFEVSLTITNTGEGPFEGGVLEVRLLRGDEQVGVVGALLEPLEAGARRTVTLWGFDDYRDGVDRAEVLLD